MINQPDNPTGNGDARDNRGRFAPGNAGGPGRPPSEAVLRFRKEFREAIEPGDVRDAARVLVQAAKAGDLDAIGELFDRTLGRPAITDYSDEIADLREAIESLKGATDAKSKTA